MALVNLGFLILDIGQGKPVSLNMITHKRIETKRVNTKDDEPDGTCVNDLAVSELSMDGCPGGIGITPLVYSS